LPALPCSIFTLANIGSAGNIRHADQIF